MIVRRAGSLTLNALVAADTVLIPIQCEFFALEGISQLMDTVDRIRDSFQHNLKVEGILLTMYDERTNLTRQVAADLAEFFEDEIFKTIIPRSVRLAEAPSHGKPILLYDVRSKGAESYIKLAKEILENDQKKRQRKALGKGLSALLPGRSAPSPMSRHGADPGSGGRFGMACRQVRIDAIEPNPVQPRTIFQGESLNELAQSIRANGIIQPLIVQQVEGGRYQLVAGERRWRAASWPVLTEVPVVVQDLQRSVCWKSRLSRIFSGKI